MNGVLWSGHTRRLVRCSSPETCQWDKLWVCENACVCVCVCWAWDSEKRHWMLATVEVISIKHRLAKHSDNVAHLFRNKQKLPHAFSVLGGNQQHYIKELAWVWNSWNHTTTMSQFESSHGPLVRVITSLSLSLHFLSKSRSLCASKG